VRPRLLQPHWHCMHAVSWHTTGAGGCRDLATAPCCRPAFSKFFGTLAANYPTSSFLNPEYAAGDAFQRLLDGVPVTLDDSDRMLCNFPLLHHLLAEARVQAVPEQLRPLLEVLRDAALVPTQCPEVGVSWVCCRLQALFSAARHRPSVLLPLSIPYRAANMHDCAPCWTGARGAPS
jgi:hypothetical protein